MTQSLHQAKTRRDAYVSMIYFAHFLDSNKGFLLGLIIFSALTIFGLIISLFAPFDPRRWGTFPKDSPPSLDHPFGTTTVGQDLFWLMSYAVRNSLVLGVIASAGGLAVGAMLGLIAGYKAGLIDRIILFFSDTLTVIPTLPILMLVGCMIRAQLDMFVLGLIIAALSWGRPVRNVRSMILSLREREFTYTARFSGISPFKLAFYEYMPYVLPWILSSFISRILGAVGTEITLAIFGLSTLSEATLGVTIYWAMEYQALLRNIWWWIASPVMVSLILFVSLFLISRGISEYLNPRAKIRRITAAKG